MKTRTGIAAPGSIMVLQEEIRRSEKSLYEHRLHAMLLVARGMSRREVGEILGDAPRTVAYWARRFESDGLAGLSDGQRSGRPSRLAEGQLAAIETALQREPAEFGLQGSWDGKTLSRFIQQQWGICLGVRQCQRLFRQFGFQLRNRRSLILDVGSDDRAE